MSDSYDKTITFYFVSGESLKMEFSQKAFESIIASLKKGWNSCTSNGDKFGINFALVTHYEVKDVG